MKKFFRLTALALAIVMLAVSLCSCQYIDNLRTHQAFYADESEREILFEEHTYKLLNPGRLNFLFTGIFDTDGNYFVSQKDVPVLIAEHEGDFVNLSSDKRLIYIWGSDDPIWYVRDDIYDKAKETLETAKLDHFNLSWLEYPEADDWYGQAKQNDILVDDDMTALIMRTLATPTNERKEYTVLSNGDYSVKAMYLKPCDADMLITDDTMIYLVKDGGKYYVWDGNVYDEYSICPVAEDDVPAVKAFFDKYDAAAQWDNIRWDFENNYYNYDEYSDEVYYGETDSGVFI